MGAGQRGDAAMPSTFTESTTRPQVAENPYELRQFGECLRSRSTEVFELAAPAAKMFPNVDRSRRRWMLNTIEDLEMIRQILPAL